MFTASFSSIQSTNVLFIINVLNIQPQNAASRRQQQHSANKLHRKTAQPQNAASMNHLYHSDTVQACRIDEQTSMSIFVQASETMTVETRDDLYEPINFMDGSIGYGEKKFNQNERLPCLNTAGSFIFFGRRPLLVMWWWRPIRISHSLWLWRVPWWWVPLRRISCQISPNFSFDKNQRMF